MQFNYSVILIWAVFQKPPNTNLNRKIIMHAPEAKNVPLQTIDKVTSVTENKDTVLYVYCYSGAQSRQAVSHLQHMGYTNVNNIGGIAAYSGKVDR